MSEFIRQNLRYPYTEDSQEERKEGVVLVEIEINHKGKVQATKVLQSLGKAFDEEACRVAKLLEFEVGKVRGIRILFHKKIKFKFKAPAVNAQTKMHYNLVSTKPKKEEPKPQPKPNKTITYTIRF